MAITDGGRILWEKSVYTKLTHSQVILPMVSEALRETELDYKDIDCAAVACGPGSYTGLRIGIGAVKGLCMGEKGLKCAGVSTLLALSINCAPFDGRITAVLRARPGIVYAGEFESVNGKVTRLSPDRVAKEEELFGEAAPEGKLLLVGDYAHEIKEKWFSGSEQVLTAPEPFLLQKASSLCLAVEMDNSLITDADKLTVSYLQDTKAEKDKAHRGE